MRPPQQQGSASKTKIRLMRRADSPAVAVMMKKLAAHHGDKMEVSAEDFSRHCLGPGRLNQTWIAFSDNTPAGFATTYDWMNFARGIPVRTLDLLFVEAKFRGQKIGRMLVSAIARDCLKKGFPRLDVSALAENQEANQFYDKLNFVNRDDGRQRHYYKLNLAGLKKLAHAPARRSSKPAKNKK